MNNKGLLVFWLTRISVPFFCFIPGVIVGSSAMQWFGFVTLFFIGYAGKQGLSTETHTFAEARLELDRLEKLK